MYAYLNAVDVPEHNTDEDSSSVVRHDDSSSTEYDIRMLNKCVRRCHPNPLRTTQPNTELPKPCCTRATLYYIHSLTTYTRNTADSTIIVRGAFTCRPNRPVKLPCRSKPDEYSRQGAHALECFLESLAGRAAACGAAAFCDVYVSSVHNS